MGSVNDALADMEILNGVGHTVTVPPLDMTVNLFEQGDEGPRRQPHRPPPTGAVRCMLYLCLSPTHTEPS